MFSEIDDETYLDDPNNLQVVSFNRVVDIEPAIIPILNLPVGSDLELVRDESGIHFVDSTTGEAMSLD